MILNKNFKSHTVIALFIILFFIIFIGYFRFSYPYLDHWLSATDADVLIAAKNFVKFGFLKCYFLPILQPQVEKPSNFYTHYPPLSSIIAGVVMRIFSGASLSIFRISPLLLSALTCWFWFLFLRRITDSYFVSLVGLLFYITNPVFILSADSICQFSYMEFLRICTIFSFVLFLEKKRTAIFIFLLLTLFINILNNFEYVIYVFLFMFLYSLFFKKSLPFKYWFIMICIVSFGFLLHFIQNAFMFGSIKSVLLDLFYAVKRRTVSSPELGNISPSFIFWFRACFVRNLYFVTMDYSRFIAIFILTIVFFKNRKKNEKDVKIIRSLKLLIIFFFCGLNWWILFPSLSIVHIHTATHMLLASALLSTLIFYFCIYFLKIESLFRAKKIIFSIIMGGLILWLLIQNILKSDLPFTKFNKLSKVLFINYSKILTGLGNNMGKDEYILTNYWNSSVMAYYSNRNSLYITTLEELKRQLVKQKYFLFFGGQKDFFEYLNSNYRPIGEYVAQNIPFNILMRFIIFEKSS